MNALTPIDPATPEGRLALRQRQDGWLPDKQRAFLEAIARGLTVEQACRFVGMSVSSAYAFRARAAGAAFALGWQAANLRARDVIADTLLARAIDGQVETTTRPDGSTVSRHRYDNRLAAAMLARLDRQAEDTAAPAHHAARLIAQDFEAFCEGLEQDDAPARAGLFLGLRAASEEADPDLSAMVALARADRFRRAGGALAAEVAIADLDPALRTGWTAEQWLRAEAAGLVALAPAPAASGDVEGDAGEPPLPPLRPGLDAGEDEEDEDEAEEIIPVWEEDDGLYMTSFPPPPGFAGHQEGRPGEFDYQRTLTPEESFVAAAAASAARSERLRDAEAERDRWFLAASMRLVEPGEHADPDALAEAERRAAADRAPLAAEGEGADGDGGEEDAPAGAAPGPEPGVSGAPLAIIGAEAHIGQASDAH